MLNIHINICIVNEQAYINYLFSRGIVTVKFMKKISKRNIRNMKMKFNISLQVLINELLKSQLIQFGIAFSHLKRHKHNWGISLQVSLDQWLLQANILALGCKLLMADISQRPQIQSVSNWLATITLTLTFILL